jgi:hypothetical protein
VWAGVSVFWPPDARAMVTVYNSKGLDSVPFLCGENEGGVRRDGA